MVDDLGHDAFVDIIDRLLLFVMVDKDEFLVFVIE